MDKIILFDGVCNLCNFSVNFIIDNDSNKIFRFASLQSKFAQNLIMDSSNKFKLFTGNGLESIDNSIRLELNSLNSILYFEDNIFYQKSDAAIQISSKLGGIFKVILVGKLIPKRIRDSIYDFIGRNRYRWFGKTESCRMPTTELKARFFE